MQYGFLLDHTLCIGCHACTVACKAENDVPVGSMRTWVKYTEQGRFPSVKRHFAVLRCNHCTNAPCVTICPVNALEKRPDGIVDLDRDACIGCRACMQACPYDAIYINEDTGAAEKCHFCAHRVERGLEPACVIVCPVQAIVPGDVHDRNGPIAQRIAGRETLVRRPEQRTGPNVHYLGVEPGSLVPGSAAKEETYLWSDRQQHKPEPWPAGLPLEPDTRTVLDTDHKIEWGWAVAMYLVTKGVAAGAAFLAPFAAALGLTGFARDWLPEVLALVFLGITTFLLVEDLHRPALFLRILTRPNWRSWLVKGSVILMAFGLTVSATVALRWAGLGAAADAVRWVSAVLALGVAGYTAYLFGQCEGRDLWQTPLLLPHLVVQALLCGFAVLLPFSGAPAGWTTLLVAVAALNVAFSALEVFRRHATDNARQAAAFMKVLRLGPVPALPASLVLLGALVPVLAVTGAWLLLPAVALIGLYLYE
jgi:Fe-S-cluster-containing dehydrogenase component